MGDLSALGRVLGVLFGLVFGLIMTVILAALGHGWASLFSLPCAALIGYAAGAALDRL